MSPSGGFDAPPSNTAFPRPAGYRFTGRQLKRTITLCIDGEGGPVSSDELLELAREAVGGWQYADAGKLPLQVEGLCPSRGTRSGDGVSVIGWKPLQGYVVGQERTASDAWGHVAEADIRIDPAVYTRGCLRSLLVHELGHVLGLDHQPGDIASVMHRYLVCDAPLSWADVAAARYLYH